MTGFTMKNKNLLVKPLDIDRRMANGVVIREQAGKKDLIAGVVKSHDKSLTIADGDVVLYPAYAADPIDTEQHGPCVIINFEDVKAVECEVQ